MNPYVWSMAIAVGAMMVPTLLADAGDGVQRQVKAVAVAGGPEEAAAGVPKEYRRAVNLLFAADKQADPNAGWLGVQIGNLQDSKKQGSDQPPGVVILNVAKGSPAEAAGFEQNDVVIEVNDEAVGDDIGSLVDRIGQAGSGGHVKFTVLRDGQRRTLVATLGSRADMKDVHWLYTSDPDALLTDSLRTHVKVLLHDDDNTWHFGDLSDVKDHRNYLAILKALPKSKGKTVKVFVNDGGMTVSTTVKQDGKTLTVERTDDGDIVVTRKTEGEDGETVTRYANEDELAKADEEAHKLYQESSNRVVINMDDDSDDDGFDFDFDLGSIDADIKGFLEKLKNSTQAFADLKQRLGDLDTGFGANAFALPGHKAHRTIHENADGTIEVIIRKGGDELVSHYADVKDLQTRSPDDYQAYLDLGAAPDDQAEEDQ